MERDLEVAGAAAALVDIDVVQRAAIRGRRTPLWMWHALAGSGSVLLAVLVAVPALFRVMPGWVTLIVMAASLAIQAWFDRRSPGTEFRRRDPRARRLYRWYVVLSLGMLFGGGFISWTSGRWWIAAVAIGGFHAYTVWTGVSAERGIDEPDRPVAG